MVRVTVSCVRWNAAIVKLMEDTKGIPHTTGDYLLTLGVPFLMVVNVVWNSWRITLCVLSFYSRYMLLCKIASGKGEANLALKFAVKGSIYYVVKLVHL